MNGRNPARQTGRAGPIEGPQALSMPKTQALLHLAKSRAISILYNTFPVSEGSRIAVEIPEKRILHQNKYYF